jgi:hypothetical protein
VLAFAIMDESSSLLLDANMQRFLPSKVTRNATALAALTEDPTFKESNLKHSING